MKIIKYFLLSPILLIIVAALIAGCTVGGNIAKSEIANKPSGDRIDIELKDESSLAGEFLTLRKESIIVLVKQNTALTNVEIQSGELPVLAEISLSRIRSAKLKNKEEKLIERGAIVSKNKQEEFRLYSRYPQGISQELMDRLLKAYDQSSLIQI